MSDQRSRPAAQTGERFKLEPLSARVLFSADMQWISAYSAMESSNEILRQYIPHQVSSYVQTQLSIQQSDQDLSKKNVFIEVQEADESQSRNFVTNSWLSSIEEKIQQAAPVKNLFLPLDDNGDLKIDSANSLDQLDVLSFAKRITMWQNHFADEATIVVYESNNQIEKNIENLRLTERALQTITGTAVEFQSLDSTNNETSALTLQKRIADSLTFTVSNLNNDGVGSLRQAILDSNSASTVSPSLIRFEVSGTIDLTEELPIITKGTIIDANYNELIADAPRIVINGSLLNSVSDGLRFENADESYVSGLMIVNFSGNGISVIKTDGFVLQNSYLGTDGLTALGNQKYGFFADSSQNVTVGGSEALGNVISSNGNGGIYMTGSFSSTADSILIGGNTIGLSLDGTANMGNLGHGIHLENIKSVQIGPDEEYRK